MALVNMALSADEAKKQYAYPSDPDGDGDNDAPKYPYGLSISLDENALEKLGIATMPAVGTQLHLVAVVEVCSVSQYENQDGKDNNLSLQITDMELAPDRAKQDAATMLYGGDK